MSYSGGSAGGVMGQPPGTVLPMSNPSQSGFTPTPYCNPYEGVAPASVPTPYGSCAPVPLPGNYSNYGGGCDTSKKPGMTAEEIQRKRQTLPCSLMTINCSLAMDNDFEVVLKYSYEYLKKRWVQSALLVKIDERPFAEGNLRKASHMIVLTEPEWKNKYVAKISKVEVDPDTYFDDVLMQALCQYMADEYNKHPVPKKVCFIDAFVIERVTKPGRPLLGCERLIEGDYIKHNSNFGFVHGDDRNTPQAFSHYSYEHSGHTCIIVDIQGVGDCYTDPQVHTSNGEGFGLGNLGTPGIQKFFQTHQCNSICVGLGLIDPTKQMDFTGTVMKQRKK